MNHPSFQPLYAENVGNTMTKRPVFVNFAERRGVRQCSGAFSVALGASRTASEFRVYAVPYVPKSLASLRLRVVALKPCEPNPGIVRNSSNHAQTRRSQYSLSKVALLTPPAGSGQSHMH